MKNRIALAAAGLLALAFAPEAAHAAACPGGTTNGYTMNLPGSVQACVVAVTLSDGRVLQNLTLVDATGAAIAPATSGAQTTGNNTLASILSGMATGTGQGTMNTALGAPADTAYAGTGSASHTAALKGIYAQLTSILTQATGANTANGTTADTAYAGTGSATEIAALKGLYSQIGTLLTANGGVADTAYAGSGSASQIAALKGLYAQLGSLLSANGAAGDTAYAGSGSASQIAALKGIYAQLGVIAGQAAPTSNPGTSIGPATGVPGFQGVTGGVPVATIGTAASNTYKLAASAAGVNATNFATATKRISAIRVCSSVTTPRFLKVFDKATAPVPGTDTPKFSVPLPTAGCAYTDAYSLSNGLGIAITAGAADADATAVGAGDVYGLNIDTN